MTAPVQDKALDASASATTIAVTMDSAIVVGNWLLLAVRRPDTSTVTVADNLGGGTPNVYTSRGYVREAAINRGIEIFTCPITQAGTPTITATYNVSTGDRGIAVREVSGTYDTSSTGTDTGSNPTTTLNATASAQPGTCHMFGVLLQGGTPTAGAGFTSAGTTWGVVDVARWQYKEYTATGSQGGGFGNAGLDRAVYANFLVIDASPPAVTVQPTDQTAADGGTASFTTTVTGATSYQWETLPPLGGSWGNVSGGSGATSDDYTTGTLSRASDAGRFYRLKATNANGDTYSNPVSVSVTAIPTSYSGTGMVQGAGYQGEAMQGAGELSGNPTGTANITLGALTLSGAGTVRVKGTATPTLGALTTSTAGKVRVKGTASFTLGALTTSATAKAYAKGTLNATLGALTLTATGKNIAKGTANLTLGALTLTADGTVSSGAGAVGTLNATLGALTLTGAGRALVRGTLSATLGAVTLTAAGAVRVKGTASVSLGALTTTTAGAVRVKGSASLALGALTTTAAGAARAKGAASVTLGALTLSASGTASSAADAIGTANITLGDLTLSATGTVSGEGYPPPPQVDATMGSGGGGGSGPMGGERRTFDLFNQPPDLLKQTVRERTDREIAAVALAFLAMVDDE